MLYGIKQRRYALLGKILCYIRQNTRPAFSKLKMLETLFFNFLAVEYSLAFKIHMVEYMK